MTLTAPRRVEIAASVIGLAAGGATCNTTDEARQLNNRRPARVGRARGEVMLNNRMSLEKWRRDG